jgi:hypothetical protein
VRGADAAGFWDSSGYVRIPAGTALTAKLEARGSDARDCRVSLLRYSVFEYEALRLLLLRKATLGWRNTRRTIPSGPAVKRLVALVIAGVVVFMVAMGFVADVL